MKFLFYLTFSFSLLISHDAHATTPAQGTTNFNSLAQMNLTGGVTVPTPTTVTNVGSLGWDFTINTEGGNVTMSTAGAGVSGASDVCIRMTRSTAGFFIISGGVKSNDGSAFLLNHVYLKINLFTGSSADMTITGYRNGVAVTGATKTITGISSSAAWTLFDLSSISGFGNVNEFRFTQAGSSSAQLSVYAIDEIDIAAAVPLPLTLINFSGLRQDNTVRLNWTTASEQNTANFEIQRSDNTVTYLPVGTIAAAGLSVSPRHYQYNDNLPIPSAGKYFYRLKMTDLDSRSTYSPVISIDANSTSFGLAAYPNPVGSSTTLSANSPATRNALLTVTEMGGRRVVSKPVYLQKGSNVLPLSFFGGLQKGVYLLQLASKDQTETIRLLKTD